MGGAPASSACAGREGRAPAASGAPSTPHLVLPAIPGHGQGAGVLRQGDSRYTGGRGAKYLTYRMKTEEF